MKTGPMKIYYDMLKDVLVADGMTSKKWTNANDLVKKRIQGDESSFLNAFVQIDSTKNKSLDTNLRKHLN